MLLRTVGSFICSLRNPLHSQLRACSNGIVFKRVFDSPYVRGENVTQEMIDKSVPDDPVYWRLVIDEEESKKEANVPPVKLILMKSIEEFGQRGQVLTMNSEKALKELLLPNLAVYASPENLEEYKDIIIQEDKVQFSSPTVQRSLPRLARTVVSLVMHDSNPWTVETWHVRVALRKVGVFVQSDDCIEINSQAIQGPNPAMEGKEFLVRLKVNNFEKVPVRCVIYQHSKVVRTDEYDDEEAVDLTALQAVVPPKGWEHFFNEPVFEDERKELEMIPRHHMDEETVKGNPELKKHLDKYIEWRLKRDKELFS